MASASDVPHRFDVVINGEGYVYADLEEVKAQFGYTPTFVPRSNTQGDFGDNFQDFWMTETQRDWTRGEQQRFYRPRQDDASASKYWDGTAVDRSIPGQVSMRKAVVSLGFAGSIVTAVGRGGGESEIFAASNSNLYEVAAAGTITDRGAHGAGNISERSSIAVDSRFGVYFSGATALRRYDTTGATFSTFSATKANALCFLNNTLFGIDTVGSFGGGDLLRYDSAGTATTLFTWKMAEGTEVGIRTQLIAYGSKLLIGKQAGDRGAELWMYDGTGVSRIAVFPPNYILGALEVVNGVVFIGGAFIESTSGFRPAVYYYSNGVYDILWKSDTLSSTSTTTATVCAYLGGLVIGNEAESTFMFFDPLSGGVTALGAYTAAGGVNAKLVAGATSFLYISNATTAYLYYGGSATATTASVTSSLFDFDSSLTKIMRGIKVEYDAASDGSASVDIAYRVGDVDGSYTTLQTGAVSGTEYLLTGVTGRSISVKVTLNKGTSTNGPVLKRVAVRAVPQQAAFRKETFVLNLTGRDGRSPVILRDGQTQHQKDGLTMAQDLRTAATSSTPITIVDEFGSFTGVIEADGFQLRRVRPNEFVAVVPVREV